MIWILPLVALATSMLSAIVGMGGGTLLLVALFGLLPHAEAIPAHAAVQVVSNSTRTLAFLRHVHWPTVGRFLVGAIPGSVCGVAVLVVLGQPREAEPYLKILFGVYILASVAIPTGGTRRAAGRWEFSLLGFAAGTAAFTVGAVGPLIAPLFARRDFLKERLIATKAICQTVLHIAKIPVFLVLRSYENLTSLGALTLAMALLVVPGTLLGKRLIRHVSEKKFVLLYRFALLAAGVKILIVDGLLVLMRNI